ncbi:MAG: DedA family protein [Lysobacterales bacterium 14-68-21]|jgi:membrane protein DedA with SNARE-associated domain|nr:MAG: DedA family protein [Xanthomonadales bacterium 15-68-25]OZB68464.1 MAG: DedA family protein [Xanthomonadales bacterium 14-68-21]
MNLLERLVGIFAEHGYLSVFIALLLCGAGVPLPEDITLVAGGIIAGLGYANVHVMVGVTMVGVLVGDATMFMLGHHFGGRILRLRLFAWLLPPARYAKVQQKFERYGNRLMFVARFLPGMRTAVFITAGATHRVSFWRFLLLDGLAALISVPLWVYLGYLGADNREWLTKWIHRGQGGVWIVLAAVLLLAAWFWWRRRQRCNGE